MQSVERADGLFPRQLVLVAPARDSDRLRRGAFGLAGRRQANSARVCLLTCKRRSNRQSVTARSAGVSEQANAVTPDFSRSAIRNPDGKRPTSDCAFVLVTPCCGPTY
jgi:hypothetical protein